MFLDTLSRVGTSTISIPLTILKDSQGTLLSSIGIGISSSALGNLPELGLFDYKSMETLSKTIFEASGKTLTGHWMDATGSFTKFYPEGVSVGLHRGSHGHHFLTNAFDVLKNDNLSVVDFYNHLATDVVTKNGLPILPPEIIESLAKLFQVSVNDIIPWVSFNILDIGASILAVGHAGNNTLKIMSGDAKWGVGYALDTFGVGSLEILAGVGTTNPFLIGAGGVDLACGTITLVDYFKKPKLLGIPIEDILSTGAMGAMFSGILSAVSMIPNWKNTSNKEKLMILARDVGEGSLLSCMSMVSLPMSLTWTLGMIGYNISKGLADESEKMIKAMPITSKFSHDLDVAICDTFIDREVMEQMKKIAKGYSDGKRIENSKRK